ncbi:MAG: type IV toxin-antitoxin system AbiEi family antitoxin domain-containing protein [Acetobacterium sp.]|uniref:type IV toxin-antitoxin system AbiEi family antitoxin domain-containing protein n=1 Tax=Acetobacterium sp. TaxID=1872094 RepID=UPI003241F12C
MDTTFQIIRDIAEDTDGIITTKQIEAAGISRTRIRSLLELGFLIKEAQGIYTLANMLVDEYKLIQLRSEKIVFSYGTALYLHGMSDRVPHFIDATVPQGDNVSRIKKEHPTIRFHYVKKELWDIGIMTIKSPQGAQLRVYDQERCICDLIRDKQAMDMQLYIQAIQGYFKLENNARKLLKYGKKFGIEEKIRTYMEVLS